MIIISSLFQYAINILRGSQGAKSQHHSNNNENVEEPGVPYELVDYAQDSRRAVPSNSDTSADGRTKTRSSTPKTEAGKEDGGERSAEHKKRHTHKYKVLFGLALPFALQSLDTTIVASALPFIAADFSTSTSPERLI